MMILDANHSSEVKEQALCILANIGDGDSAKDFIMNNEDILKKLQEYMVGSNDVVRFFCVTISLNSIFARYRRTLILNYKWPRFFVYRIWCGKKRAALRKDRRN